MVGGDAPIQRDSEDWDWDWDWDCRHHGSQSSSGDMTLCRSSPPRVTDGGSHSIALLNGGRNETLAVEEGATKRYSKATPGRVATPRDRAISAMAMACKGPCTTSPG